MQSYELEFFLTKKKNTSPTSAERLFRGYTKVTPRSTREGNGCILLTKKIKTSTAEGSWRNPERPSSCDPGWCVHKSDFQNKWDDNATTQHMKSLSFLYHASICLQKLDNRMESCAFSVTTCVCIFIELHITAQSLPVILVILCHSHRSSQAGIKCVCVCLCVYVV